MVSPMVGAYLNTAGCMGQLGIRIFLALLLPSMSALEF